MWDAIRYKPSNTGGEKEGKGIATPRLNAMYTKETILVSTMSLKCKGNGYMQEWKLHDDAAFALLLVRLFHRLWYSRRLRLLAESILDRRWLWRRNTRGLRNSRCELEMRLLHCRRFVHRGLRFLLRRLLHRARERPLVVPPRLLECNRVKLRQTLASYLFSVEQSEVCVVHRPDPALILPLLLLHSLRVRRDDLLVWRKTWIRLVHGCNPWCFAFRSVASSGTRYRVTTCAGTLVRSRNLP
jgi:hypothetical protein